LLKFHQIILKKFFLIFLILFLIVGAIVYYWIKEFYIFQTQEELLNNIEILSFELKKDSNLDTLANKIKKNLNLRLTIISSKGEVIAESHKDKTKMDNHKNRDEIIQASNEKFGYKIRHSHTVNKDLLYIAKHYNFGNDTIFIRFSKELKSINEQILSLGIKIVGVLMLFFLGIFFMAYKTSKQIETETVKIVNFLSSLTKKNKNTYINSDFSLEFSQITKLLTKVAQILSKKEKQKAKYTNRLQKSNQQKDDIISAISHEFKNPIAVINGYTQTLLDDENINPNIQKKFLTKIHNNGIKLSDLIDTLRLSIKLDSGKQSMNFMKLNLYELVVDSIENIEVNYPKRDIIIEGDKDIRIQADTSLFSIVLSNLIENAFKYSKDDIFIKFNEKEISIIDSGIGISRENLKNITTKFYRVHENSWNNSLGLGLFIVNNITKLHNFKLAIQSEENQGSTFTIIF
jgi:signal transduction histidine kinase